MGIYGAFLKWATPSHSPFRTMGFSLSQKQSIFGTKIPICSSHSHLQYVFDIFARVGQCSNCGPMEYDIIMGNYEKMIVGLSVVGFHLSIFLGAVVPGNMVHCGISMGISLNARIDLDTLNILTRGTCNICVYI